MGFGTLFSFYIVSFILSFNPYGGIFRLVGYLGMLMGLWELQQYQKTFLYAVYTMPAMLLVAAYQTCMILDSSLGIPIPFVTDAVSAVFGYADYIVMLIFHAALFCAIWSIAKEIGLPKIMQNTAHCAIVMGVYYAMYLIGLLPFGWVATYLRYVGAVVVLFPLFWAILNVMLIYSCYKNICKEGDEEVPLRVSRFAFVNRIRQEMERKEQKGIEETIEHAKRNREEHLAGQARNRELRIKYAERRDKAKKHKNQKIMIKLNN